MLVIFAVRFFFFFTTIVPRLLKTTNSQNKVAVMIIGGDERASSLRIGAKKSVQEKTARVAGVGRGGEG